MTMPTPPVNVPLDVRARIRFRRAFTPDWKLVNPILRDGEPGYDKTLNMLKVGDGVTPWNDLPFLSPPEQPPIVVTGDMAIDAVMSSHINDPTPHPAYDDGPSLILLYQNAKV